MNPRKTPTLGQLKALKEFFDPDDENNLYFEIIKDYKKVDPGTKIVYLLRAINEDCQSYLRSLDKLYNPHLSGEEAAINEGFIRSLKLINDLYHNNEVKLVEPFGITSALNATLGRLGDIPSGDEDLSGFQEEIVALINKGIAKLTGTQVMLVQYEIEKRLEYESTLPGDTGWREEGSSFDLPTDQLASNNGRLNIFNLDDSSNWEVHEGRAFQTNRRKSYINDNPNVISHMNLYGFIDNTYGILLMAAQRNAGGAFRSNLNANHSLAQSLERHGINRTDENIRMYPSDQSRLSNLFEVRGSLEEIRAILNIILNVVKELEGPRCIESIETDIQNSFTVQLNISGPPAGANLNTNLAFFQPDVNALRRNPQREYMPEALRDLQNPPVSIWSSNFDSTQQCIIFDGQEPYNLDRMRIQKIENEYLIQLKLVSDIDVVALLNAENFSHYEIAGREISFFISDQNINQEISHLLNLYETLEGSGRIINSNSSVRDYLVREFENRFGVNLELIQTQSNAQNQASR